MRITAKVFLASTVEQQDQVQLTFGADYGDGRNKEWAKYTPYLNVVMMVKPEVAANFTAKSYTLTFDPDEDT